MQSIQYMYEIFSIYKQRYSLLQVIVQSERSVSGEFRNDLMRNPFILPIRLTHTILSN